MKHWFRLDRYWTRFFALLALATTASLGGAFAPHGCNFGIFNVIYAAAAVVTFGLPLSIVAAFPATRIPWRATTALVFLALLVTLPFVAYALVATLPHGPPCRL